jgi:hypothetical protein
MKRIVSNEYLDAVKEYFTDNKEPARVYRFLLVTLRADNYKLPDDLLYRSVDTLETTGGCFRFCEGS